MMELIKSRGERGKNSIIEDKKIESWGGIRMSLV